MASLNQKENPYRVILRREYPEPLIALLAFILGIWLWDHYFGKPEGYAPGTEEIALVKIDRDLRLADAMTDDPPWLKWLVGVDSPERAREDALGVFTKLASDESISGSGLEAFAIVKSVQDGVPMTEALGIALHGQMISDLEETSRNLAKHKGTWWQAKLIDSWEQSARPSTQWRTVFGEDSMRLRTRAVVVRSVVWLLGVAGLAFIPLTLIRLRQGIGTKRKHKGYGGAWPISMGLVIFLLATLAWIGFNMTLEVGISQAPGLHPLVWIFLDSTARMMPALIILGLIFRRPSHALRVLGLNQPVALKEVLGAYSMLIIIDQVLRWVMNYGGSNEPGGGLSLGDAGLWGLVFALISGCLLAPVCEEIVYRGVLFRTLRNQLGVITAAFLSAVIFSTLHFYDGYGLISVGIFGFSCALLYSATGSLATTITLHMCYNASIKIPEWIVYHAPLG